MDIYVALRRGLAFLLCMVIFSDAAIAGVYSIQAATSGTATRTVVASERSTNGWYMECTGNTGVTVTVNSSMTISCGGIRSPTYAGTSPAQFVLEFTNPSSEIAALTWIAFPANSGINRLAEVMLIYIPAGSSCSALLMDAELGSLSRGENSSTSLLATTTGSTGTAPVVTFSGDDLRNDGLLYLGGTSTGVTLTPTGSGYISGASWRSTGSITAIPLAVRVSSAATAGPLQSTLTAKIACK